MNQEKQKLYDAFMAGTELYLESLDASSRQLWRGRFEEWLDEQEKVDAGEAMTRQIKAHAEATRHAHEAFAHDEDIPLTLGIS